MSAGALKVKIRQLKDPKAGHAAQRHSGTAAAAAAAPAVRPLFFGCRAIPK